MLDLDQGNKMTTETPHSSDHFAVSDLRREFPIFTAHPGLAYLDSGASSQKPSAVIDAIKHYYETSHANVHRGVYGLSEEATRLYEEARIKLARFIGATKPEEVIFTRGTTEAINLVASILTEKIKAGDEILLSIAEHHSNIVPWQMLATRTGAVVRFLPLNEDYRIDLQAAAEMITERTKILAVAHVSNVLGTIHPIGQLIAMAKRVGAYTVLDGAQGAAHLPLDVGQLGVDFYAFSGHKMVGPTGIGVLYGKEAVLEDLPPYQGGGDMIETVTIEGSTWAALPNKYEAGTPNIAGAIGLGAAADFLSKLPRDEILAHERSLGQAVLARMREHPRVRVFSGDAEGRYGEDWVGIVTFVHEQIHPHDLATIADTHKVCIRAGHHCAQPLMKVFGVQATARISPYLYNDAEDIEKFFKALHNAEQLFA